MAAARTQPAHLSRREGETVALVGADGVETETVVGRRREARCFCGSCGHKWPAVVAAAADRYGHVCPNPECNKPTGFEVS